MRQSDDFLLMTRIYKNYLESLCFVCLIFAGVLNFKLMAGYVVSNIISIVLTAFVFGIY